MMKGVCKSTSMIVTVLTDKISRTMQEVDNYLSNLKSMRVLKQASTAMKTGKLETMKRNKRAVRLPPYSQVHKPSLTWGNLDGSSFTHIITCLLQGSGEEKYFKDPGKAGTVPTLKRQFAS